MNPKSIYKEQLLNKVSITNKKFVFNDKITNNHENSIVIEPPKIKNELPKSSDPSQINYNIDNLKQTIEANKEDVIHLCIYTIQTQSKFPYLLYLLYKHQTDFFTFPYFHFENGDLSEQCEEKITSIIDIPHDFKGYIKQDNNIYVFYELENNSYKSSLIKRNEDWWFTLVYEICYSQSFHHFPIHQSVYDCFMNNKFLTLLYDDNHYAHEVPMPLYLGGHEKHLNYLFTFGAQKTLSTKALHGQYYSYYSYDSACRYGLWTNDFKENEPYTENKYGLYKKGGIIRYASFVGNTKVFINTNEIKDELNDNIQEKYKKISDNYGDWANDYDSVYIGNDMIDNMKHIGFRYTLKDNSQIDPLSYHYLDKSKIESMYNPKKNYEII